MAVAIALIYVIIALASLAFYCIKKRLNYWKEQGIAHDEPNFWAGNFQGIMTKRSIANCIRETYEKHKGSGPFCGFYFFQRPAVLVLDTDLVKNVLIKDFSKFTDRGLYHNEKDDPLTGHLFQLDGAKWKNLRNKLSPTFTSGKMKLMYPTITDVAERFVDVFRETSQEDNVVEIKELLARFTTDVIGRCAFGINCNSLQEPNAEFRLMGKRCLSERRHGRFLNGFMQGFPKLAKKLHMCLLPDEVTAFFVRIVRETVAYREQHDIKAHDFLSILMDLKNGEGKGHGVALSLEEMAAQVFVFFLAGFETSSSTMSFALYELAQNQDIQEKMRNEINEIFDEQGKSSYEEIHGLEYLGQVISEEHNNTCQTNAKTSLQRYNGSMKCENRNLNMTARFSLSSYLSEQHLLFKDQYGFQKGCGTEEAVVNVVNYTCDGLDRDFSGVGETLRKYTIVPHLNRKALSDYVVPGYPKYIIKKDMPVLIPAYAMHHDPALYPDPEKFDPERFADDVVKQRDSVEWLPFGDGPRNCIGMRFGWMQTRVGLAYLLRNFRFSVSDRTEIPFIFNKKTFLLSTKNGIYLKVEKL